MYYVGHKIGGGLEMFTAEKEPTVASHGDKYLAVIGAFDTKRGAAWYEKYGRGNPHIVTVADAERLARAASRLNGLKREAMAAARWRGHDMPPFVELGGGRAVSDCRRCGKGVCVILNPAPNDIDIGGGAVAVGCVN